MSLHRKKKNDLFGGGPKGSFLLGLGSRRGAGALCRVGRRFRLDHRRVGPARLGRGPRTAGRAYPTGSRGSYEASGRGAPLPAYPAGPHFSREMGERGRGQAPGPPFLCPLTPARSPFALGGAAGTIYRLLRCPFLAPDLGTFFFGNFFGADFLRENPTPNFYTRKEKNPDQGTTKETEIVPQSWQCGTEPKAERAGASGLKKGGRGTSPDFFASGLSLRKPGSRQGPGGKDHLQVLTCEGSQKDPPADSKPRPAGRATWTCLGGGRLTALSAGGGYPLPGTLGRGTPPGAGRPPGPSTAGGCPRGLSWRRSPCASHR